MRTLIGLLVVLTLGACASEGPLAPEATAGTGASDPTGTPSPTSSGSGAVATSQDSATTDPTSTPTPTTTTTEPQETSSTTAAPAGWIEMGWGVAEFNAFANGEVPVFVGPQGLDMFSIPLRGADFLVPDDPTDFMHPDIPVMDIWVDIEGLTKPGEHFSAYSDYPVPFMPDLETDADVEFVAIWLVMPNDVVPADIYGLTARLHMELRCADGQVLTDDRELTITAAVQK